MVRDSMRQRVSPKSSWMDAGISINDGDIDGRIEQVMLPYLNEPRRGRKTSLIITSLAVISGFSVLVYSLKIFSEHRYDYSTTPSSSPMIRKNFPHVKDPSSTDNQIHECGIWMAPSSLRPNPGFGIFTTRDIAYDESILHQPDAVSISLHDMRRRRDVPLWEERRQLWMNVFGNYVWNYGVPDHNRYDHPPDEVDFQPGFGSLPNHHCLLASLAEASTAEHPPYNDALLYLDEEENSGNSSTTSATKKWRQHGESPGTGAFSYSLGRDFFATRDLKAGEEIFLNYGHCKRHPDKTMESWQKEMIYPEDVKEASRILKMLEPFGKMIWPVGMNVSEICELAMTDSDDSEVYLNANSNHVIKILSGFSDQESRQSLYDRLMDDVSEHSKTEIIHSMGSGSYKKDSYEEIMMKKLWFEVAKSTLEPAGKSDPQWIKEHGACLENLIPIRSSIPDAGFGGFAQFPVAKGDIVVPAPVLQVVNKDTLMLYERDVENPLEHPIGMSLLMNYCFGHSESTMLLCPMTSAILLNHCSKRGMDCGPNGPNAEIRWSSEWDTQSYQWRNATLNKISKQKRRLLSFEIVALRDISPGEEVFIDYGVEWEKAWQKHVQQWVPPSIDENFISAQEANSRSGPVADDFISGDLRETVNHPYLFTGCVYGDEKSSIRNSNYTRPNKGWKNLSDVEILETYATSGEPFVYEKEGYARHYERSHWPCSVLYKETEGRYTVRIHQSPLRGVEPATTDWDETRSHAF